MCFGILAEMKKLKYLVTNIKYSAWNFAMPTLEKDGRTIPPEFENGRIIIREQKSAHNIGHAELGIMKPPTDEETENHEIFWKKFANALKYNPATLGYFDLIHFDASEGNAKFEINVREEERNKGYGTVLMNAGAKYCRSLGLKTFYGDFNTLGDTAARKRFYERFGMPKNSSEIRSDVNNPLLSTIKFTCDNEATEILNSIQQLQRL